MMELPGERMTQIASPRAFPQYTKAAREIDRSTHSDLRCISTPEGLIIITSHSLEDKFPGVSKAFFFCDGKEFWLLEHKPNIVKELIALSKK